MFEYRFSSVFLDSEFKRTFMGIALSFAYLHKVLASSWFVVQSHVDK